MNRETGPPQIFVGFFLAIIVWKNFLLQTIRMFTGIPISNSAKEDAEASLRGSYCTVTKSGCACESPPLRFPSNCGRMMTLFTQVELLTRNAALPQFFAMRFVKA